MPSTRDGDSRASRVLEGARTKFGRNPLLEIGRVVLLLVSVTGLVLEILALRGALNFGGSDGTYPLWLGVITLVPIMLVSLSVLKWPNAKPPDPPPGP